MGTASRLLQITVVATSAVALAATAGCVGDVDDGSPTQSPSPEPELRYSAIPTDACAASDIAALEPLLGPIEDQGPDYSDEDETISIEGDTFCDIYYNDGPDASRVVIEIELRNEPVGEASSQDPDHDYGYFWAYTDDSADDNLDGVPEPEGLAVSTSWESSQLLHFPEVSDDRLNWDPDGHGLALIGTFTDSNVMARISLTMAGHDENSVPEPGPYVEQLTGLAEQLFDQLVPR